MLSFYHNSQKTNYREPFGAVPQGTAVAIFIDVYDDMLDMPDKFLSAEVYVQQNVTLCDKASKIHSYVELERAEGSGEVVDTEYGRRIKHVFKATIETPLAGIYFYCFDFKVQGANGYRYYVSYGNNEMCLGGEGKVYGSHHDKMFQITVYEKELSVPKWLTEGIIYQIFPDRFSRAQDALSRFKPNSFAYGSWYDLPMYVRDPATNGIARWDFFGGNLMGVTQKLPYIESLGVSVIYLNPIFDAVSNHRYDTSDYKHVDSLLGGDSSFDLLMAAGHAQGMRFILDGVFSHTGSDSIYFDKEGKYGCGAYKNPNSPYRSWYRFGNHDDDYECWWGVKVMPNVEELEPSYLDYIVRSRDSVIKHWIRKGADGWRLDVADELPDEFIKALREAADEAAEECGKESIVLGEVWEDASNKISYEQLRTYFTSKELHSVTNYPFRKNMLAYFSGEESSDSIVQKFNSLKENYPRHNFYALVNMTGTHDVARLMTLMLDIAGGDRAKARELVKAYAAVMFTFAGVPLVYYGDETCLEGGVDPDNRRTYPWGRADNEMIEYFSSLGALRKSSSLLKHGDINFKSADGFFVFERTFENCYGLDDEGADEAIKSGDCKKLICAVAPVRRMDQKLSFTINNMKLAEGETATVIACGGDDSEALSIANGDTGVLVKNFVNYVIFGVK